MDRDEMSNLYKGPSKYASYQGLIHLARLFQRRRFFQESTNQKQEWPVAAMFVNGSGKNEQSLLRTFHRCFLPSFGSFGLQFQRKRFLEIDQSETRIACSGHVCTWIGTKLALFYRGPPIDASYQVSVHLAKRFQRRF